MMINIKLKFQRTVFSKNDLSVPNFNYRIGLSADIRQRRAGKESTKYSNLRELPVWYMPVDSVQRLTFETVISTSQFTLASGFYFR